jgi:hypothetical protein
MRSAWSPTQHAPGSGVLHQWGCLSCGNGRSRVGPVESAPERTVLADRMMDWNPPHSPVLRLPRIQRIDMAPWRWGWPLGAVQLHHPLAVVGQQPRQAGALAGCASTSQTSVRVLQVWSRPDGGQLPEVCQKRCLAMPHTALGRLSRRQPLTCDVVLPRWVPQRCAWCSRSLHTAEATGSKPVTPTRLPGSAARRSAARPVWRCGWVQLHGVPARPGGLVCVQHLRWA